MNETFKDVLKNLACALDTKGTTDPLIHFKGGYAFVYTDYYAETEVPEDCQGTLTLSSLKKAGDFPLKQTAWAGEVVHMARGRTKMAITKESMGLKKIQRKSLPLEGGIVPVGKLLEGMDFCRKTLLQHDSFSSLSCFFFRKDGVYTTNGESFSFFPCEFSNNFCLPHDAYSKIKGFQAEECTLSGSESLTFVKKGSAFYCPTFQTDTLPPFKRILSQQFSALFKGDSSAWDINPKEIATLAKNATDIALTCRGKSMSLQINGAGSVYKQPLFPFPETKTVYISKETLSALLSAEEIGLNDKCIKVSLPDGKIHISSLLSGRNYAL